MSGWSHSMSATSGPPWITLSTPGGTPASCASSTRRMVELGSCSEGLSMKVLPQAIAMGNMKQGSITGKLKAVMPAPTPSGCSRLYTSTPVAAFSAISPSCSVVMEQACSTTSRPRATSPSASGRVLPCSRVISWASSAVFSRIRCCSLSMMRMRAPSELLRQVWKAWCALATASSTSSRVAKGTRATTSCVAGLVTSRHWLVLDG